MVKVDSRAVAVADNQQRAQAHGPEVQVPASQKVPPSRRGGQYIGAYVNKKVARQLKELAARKGMTIQVLICRGLNMVFHEEGLPTIAKEERTPRR